jgi:hypothetical protein
VFGATPLEMRVLLKLENLECNTTKTKKGRKFNEILRKNKIAERGIWV